MNAEAKLRRRLVDRIVTSAGRMAQAEYELGVVVGAGDDHARLSAQNIADKAAVRLYQLVQRVVRNARRSPNGEKAE
jgi:hypothetical protein